MKEILYTHFPQGSLHDREESIKKISDGTRHVPSLGGEKCHKKTYDDLSRWNGSGGTQFGESCPFFTVGYNKRHRDFEEDDMMVFATDINIEYAYCNQTFEASWFSNISWKNTILGRWTYQGCLLCTWWVDSIKPWKLPWAPPKPTHFRSSLW